MLLRASAFLSVRRLAALRRHVVAFGLRVLALGLGVGVLRSLLDVVVPCLNRGLPRDALLSTFPAHQLSEPARRTYLVCAERG